MTLSEPMTLATDYLLGAVTAWLCIRLAGNRQSQNSRTFWALAFAALALVIVPSHADTDAAARSAGTAHIFVPTTVEIPARDEDPASTF